SGVELTAQTLGRRPPHPPAPPAGRQARVRPRGGWSAPAGVGLAHSGLLSGGGLLRAASSRGSGGYGGQLLEVPPGPPRGPRARPAAAPPPPGTVRVAGRSHPPCPGRPVRLVVKARAQHPHCTPGRAGKAPCYLHAQPRRGERPADWATAGPIGGAF